MPPTPRPSPDEPRRAFALEVVRRLRGADFQALWAGGCVRDLILGHEPADYDVATDAPPEAVMRLFRRTVPVGVSFGVVRVLGPPGAGEVEVATFRSDGRYLDGRRPETVRFGSPREDAARRDFTINGMFLDPLTDEVIDYVGGRDDLRAGLIRAIGDPHARFAEDKLRLLRAVRFAARFRFELEAETRAALVAMAEQVRIVAAERIAQELRRMLVHTHRRRGLELARDAGLLAALLPELPPLRGGTEPGRESGAELWERALRRLDALPESPGFPLALAALLHDAPIPRLLEAALDGPILPLVPDQAARMGEDLARDLRLSNHERDHLVWLLRQSRQPLRPGVLPIAAYKRLLAAPGLDDLLTLQQAESRALGGDAADVAACRAYLRDLPDGAIDPPPLITGNDLIALGLKPGPEFKHLLDAARDAQLENRIRTRDEALAWLRMRE